MLEVNCGFKSLGGGKERCGLWGVCQRGGPNPSPPKLGPYGDCNGGIKEVRGEGAIGLLLGVEDPLGSSSKELGWGKLCNDGGCCGRR